jgi:hypothetical protein
MDAPLEGLILWQPPLPACSRSPRRLEGPVRSAAPEDGIRLSGVLQRAKPRSHGIAVACLAALASRPTYSGSIGKEELTMSEDAAKMMDNEQLLIHLEPAWERRNWCNWLACSEAELEHAVTYVGHDPDNVRRFLRQAR